MTLCILGCSTGSPPAPPAATPTPTQPAAPTPVYPDITGNWSFSAQPGLSTAPPFPLPPVFSFTGYLTSSGPTVSGILRAGSVSPLLRCASETMDLPVTGTIDTDGHLKMTVPIAGGVAMFDALVPQSRSTFFSNSSLQITGGACSQAQSLLEANQIASVTGTYIGTLQTRPFLVGNPIQTATVTATLAQSPSPNADGQFPLSGTITLVGACTGTYTFLDGLVYGERAMSPVQETSGIFASAIFSAAAIPDANTLLGVVTNLAGCPDVYSGPMKRQ